MGSTKRSHSSYRTPAAASISVHLRHIGYRLRLVTQHIDVDANESTGDGMLLDHLADPLVAWADELNEIKTICHSGRKATMTVRVDDAGRAVQQGPQVEIGGNERYVSVSRAEFKKVMRGESAVGELPELQQPSLL